MGRQGFQVVVATHLNTECLHNHFVVNSVSFVDGKHYHDNKATCGSWRQRSDELCREYALSVIEKPSGRKKPYALYRAEKNGLPTRDTVARQAVDEAISKSYTLKDFDRLMAEMGYRCSFDPNHKYWTIIGKGWKRPKRLYKLGEDYTNERILERIKENSYAVKFSKFAEPQKQVTVYRLKGSLKNAKKIGGLQWAVSPLLLSARHPAKEQKTKLRKAPLSSQRRFDEDGCHYKRNKAALPQPH